MVPQNGHVIKAFTIPNHVCVLPVHLGRFRRFVLIYCLNKHETVRFAAAELRRYLAHVTGARLAVRAATTYAPGKSALWVGTFDAFPRHAPTASSSHPFDDELFILTKGASGIIAGANPRSVVLAAYRYLTELGFRWVRPGKEGEVMPRRVQSAATVDVHECAAYRHRGVCIEGAVSYRHVRDMVDWLPKVGMNAYFIQFREAFTFFERWYTHEGNPHWKARPFDVERARAFTERIRGEIRKRGLVLHMVGHGWTCDPFRIEGRGWYEHKGPLPKKVVRHLAEVNGKRAFWNGIPLNTNLCYGNPRTREIVADAVVDYAAVNPDVDIIHVWLADDSNNHCECPRCTRHRPADLYVKMLNAMDEKLSHRGLPTRIAFLIYVDLLWPPRKEHIRNPDRFILMFAPITRSYSRSFASACDRPAIGPYRRNKLKFSREPGANLAFLQAWQRRFGGDSFDFDYHYMWDHYKDPGYYAMARVLHEDLCSLKEIGLGGFNSCQTQRAFFPTGLGMYVMARTLWNSDAAFDDTANEYFRAAFGARGDEVAAYMRRLSELFDPRLLRGELSEDERAEVIGRFGELEAHIAAFQPVIKRGTRLSQPTHARSWAYLRHHARICRMMVEVLANPAVAKERGSELVEYIRTRERELHPVLDVWLYQRVIPPSIGLPVEGV